MDKMIFNLNCSRKGKPHPKPNWMKNRAEALRKHLFEILSTTAEIAFSVRVKGARLIVILTKKGGEEIAKDVLSQVVTLLEEKYGFKQVNSHLFSLF